MGGEIKEFRLPDLGEGLAEAEIVRWIVKVGDDVALNDPIVEVETEKAIVEIPSPFEGIVEQTFGDVGQRVKVGSALITIRTAQEATTSGRREVLVGYGPDEGVVKRRKERKVGRRVQVSAEPESRAIEGGLATPPVRKLAKDLGVDIAAVRGSGPGGRVTRQDVLAGSAAGGVAGQEPIRSSSGVAEEERIPVRAIRRSIAERMVKSKFTIPHVAEWLQIDATELMRLRGDLATSPEGQGIKISPLPILARALIAALRTFPILNSQWDEQRAEIVIKRVYHLGIATDTDRGLLVPVVKYADQFNVFDLAREIARLASAARDGTIGPADLTGSTITITNVGSFGVESGTPIVNYPECAIIAPGLIAKRPWVVGDQILVRDVMTLAMSFDHRIIDGAHAGRFLRHLGDLLERPARLLGVL